MSRITFFKKEDSYLFLLLGYLPNHVVYKKAFIHKSFNSETHNERLEFLGDAVLSLIIAEFLFLEKKARRRLSFSKKSSNCR